MGYITNQWITRIEGLNRRGHELARVNLVSARPTSRFSQDHGLVIRLVAEKEHSHDQQVVHFDECELLNFIGCSVQDVAPGLRAKLVAKVLGEMSDEELVSALNSEIAKRYPRRAAE